MGKPLCQSASESYFHALHDVTTGRAQSHGFRGWTGNGDARNAHRSAAQNGNGSGRETGGSLVSSSSSPPPSSSSNISCPPAKPQFNCRTWDSVGGFAQHISGFFPLLPFPSDKTEAAEPSAALRQLIKDLFSSENSLALPQNQRSETCRLPYIPHTIINPSDPAWRKPQCFFPPSTLSLGSSLCLISEGVTEVWSSPQSACFSSSLMRGDSGRGPHHCTSKDFTVSCFLEQ
ncbi:hypothetical protein F2P79_014153 [Pimephales promelas]|nr:hypothetical protein F2P79_014153 [Pimephales promelas]